MELEQEELDYTMDSPMTPNVPRMETELNDDDDSNNLTQDQPLDEQGWLKLINETFDKKSKVLLDKIVASSKTRYERIHRLKDLAKKMDAEPAFIPREAGLPKIVDLGTHCNLSYKTILNTETLAFHNKMRNIFRQSLDEDITCLTSKISTCISDHLEEFKVRCQESLKKTFDNVHDANLELAFFTFFNAFADLVKQRVLAVKQSSLERHLVKKMSFNFREVSKTNNLADETTTHANNVDSRNMTEVVKDCVLDTIKSLPELQSLISKANKGKGNPSAPKPSKKSDKVSHSNNNNGSVNQSSERGKPYYYYRRRVKDGENKGKALPKNGKRPNPKPKS